MANLEEHALRRDKRFIVRLVLSLLIGMALGLFLFAKLTSRDLANCGASGFTRVTGESN